MNRTVGVAIHAEYNADTVIKPQFKHYFKPIQPMSSHRHKSRHLRAPATTITFSIRCSEGIYDPVQNKPSTKAVVVVVSNTDSGDAKLHRQSHVKPIHYHAHLSGLKHVLTYR